MQRRSLLATVLTAAIPGVASAQSWPSRPIRLVVGFPPGGGSDLVARPLAQRMQAILGQPMVVENRGGANGNLGLEAVAKSAADGYTIGHVNNSVIAVNPLLYRHLSFDAARELTPLCAVTTGGLVMMVPAALPIRTLPELVAAAKARPGELNFAAAGMGGVTHLAFELFRKQTGADIALVPYRGSAPALQDLLANRVQLMIDGINLAKAQIDAGTVRPIAMLTRERNRYLPEVPTTVEQGYPELVSPGWQGFVAPAGVPAPILDRLEAAFREALASDEVQQIFAAQATIPAFRGRAEMAGMIREETTRWGPIIAELGIRLD